MAEYKIDVLNPVRRLARLLRLERKEIGHIYFYASLSGFIYLTLPLGIQAIVGILFGGVVTTSLAILIAVVVGGVLLNGVVQVMQLRITERIQQRIFTYFALEYSYRIPKMDMVKLDAYFLPELVNRFLDTASVQKGISKVLIDIPTVSIQILFGLILLSLYHPVFVAFSVLLIVIIWLLIRYAGPAGIKSSIQESNYKYEVAYWLEEVARTVRTLKFTGTTRFPVEKTDHLLNGYLDAREAHFRVLVVQYWGFIAFKVIVTATLLILGSFLLIGQQINLGQFIAAEIVIILVLNSVEKLITSLESIYDLLTALEKTGKVLDSPLERDEGLEIEEICSGKGMNIRLENLSLSYPDSDGFVLHGVNLDIPSGSKVCISGSQGAGKSSLLRLLAGEFSAYSGNVLINSYPLSNINLIGYRKRLGIVLARTDLFPGTILENICLGEEIPLHEVLELAERLKLLSFIQSKAEGLQHKIESQGRKLPKGIIARILLCRALIRKPRLLLIEDCWSDLDEVSKEIITHSLLNLPSETILIVSSNDQNFAARCDIRAELDAGILSIIQKP